MVRSSALTKTKKSQIQQAVEALTYRERYGKLLYLYPDSDDLHPTDIKRRFYAREKYQKQLAFFRAGRNHKRRALLAGNRTGKTVAAGFEVTCHLTGTYPDWWEGKKFTRPTQWWIVGQTTKNVKEILQPLLLGENGDFGSGMIPKHLLDLETMTDAKKVSTKITSFRVKHKPSGLYSLVEFKSCEEGSSSFQGTERSIWLDEEAPLSVYNECNTRTMTTDDIVIMTFTPLNGMTELIMNFTNDGDYSEGDKGHGRHVTNITWSDVPHLDEKAKEELLADTPIWLRDARSKGIPTVGEGLCFAYPEDKVFIDPFPIPPEWKRVYAIDFGWSPDPTAILWVAIDPVTDIHYLYHEHYATQMTPVEHSKVIHALNTGAQMIIPGVCDPSGGGKSLKDGKTTREDYGDVGIYFQNADNAVEPGLVRVNSLLRAGKIKAFNTLSSFRREYRLYKKNHKGKFVGPDHLADCLRYIVLTGYKLAKSAEQWKLERQEFIPYKQQLDVFDMIDDGWMYRC